MTQANILFLMADQLQGRVFEAGHACRTPHIDRLIANGVRIRNAYTSNAICSPARAGIMTGLLPHNHGVVYVTHNVDDDQSCLRTEYPHFAQHLVAAGYQTGYFGKWHVERSGELESFGWQQYKISGFACEHDESFSLLKHNEQPGYEKSKLYGVTDASPLDRPMGRIASAAIDFLEQQDRSPWCCFVSVPEPHDPFVCGEEAFGSYGVDALEVQPNWRDDLDERPGLYRKAARIWSHLTERERKEAAACYYASITEIDTQFGRVLKKIEEMGQFDNTIVIVLSDHGESLGAHGLYCKNISASEEIYNIPMIVAGPGVAEGVCTDARVGSHDVCPTILELVDAEPFSHPDSKSFARLLSDPANSEEEFTTGYAEYHGGRYILTQRIVYDGAWKFVYNGFDFDELYNLSDDPYELTNLASHVEHQERIKQMTCMMWDRINETNDKALRDSHYAIFRLAAVGPYKE